MPEDPQTPVTPAPETPPISIGSMPPLVPSDPGPIPPATSMNIPPGLTGSPSFSPTATPPSPNKSKKRSSLIMAVALVVLLAVAYVFAIYLPNTPDNVYSASLVNSGKALDTLIDYSKRQQHANYQSTALNSTLHVKSPNGSYDVSLTGNADKNSNANFQMDGDFVGAKVTANLRTIHVNGSDSPDVYLQVNGIKSYLDSLGLNSFDSLNGQWISIDHTLIDTYLSKLEQGAGANSKNASAPTYADVEDAAMKVQTVDKQYIFTTDDSKAVLTNQKFLGKTTQSGRTFNHYQVGYNKAHLEAYVTALGNALDSSQLNNWSKAANAGKSLSKEMNFTSLENSVKNAKSDYTFELWADPKTKLISKLKFVDANDKGSWFTVSQGYDGGSQYPFGLSFVDSANSDGTRPTGSMNLTLDTSTNKASANFSGTSGASSANGNFTITPGHSPVTVTAPKGAKSLTNILTQFGLGGLLSGDALSGQSNVKPGGPAIFSQT